LATPSPTSPIKVCVIGEGMAELSRDEHGWRVGYGGDTLNTAIHLARFGEDVSYVTALGADPFSDDLRAAWIGEGLDAASLLTDPHRNVGLYAIRTDPRGERSFTYWRGDSAARGLFALPGIGEVLERNEGADLIVFSLITVAILPPDGRAQLLAFCRKARARGARVAFDGNYRPRLWPDARTAAAARDSALACCDFGLPTLDDEHLLCGETSAEAVAAHWRAAGAAEVVVKLGALGCLAADGERVAPPTTRVPLDTSGAGDAFNAGYLCERMRGASSYEAAMAGHRLAGWVIGRAGAIPPRDAEAPYGAAPRP